MTLVVVYVSIPVATIVFLGYRQIEKEKSDYRITFYFSSALHWYSPLGRP